MNEGKIAPKAQLLTNAIRHLEERKTNGNSLRKIRMISMPLPSLFINSPSVVCCYSTSTVLLVRLSIILDWLLDLEGQGNKSYNVRKRRK